MSMPKSKFWSPTKQGKIYAGILSVIVVLASWYMAINSLVEIPWRNPCAGEPSVCTRSPGEMPLAREIKTDYMNLNWGLSLGLTCVIFILLSSLYLKNGKQGNRHVLKVNLEVPYYLFLYFAFLSVPILNSYVNIRYGHDLSFIPLLVQQSSIVSLVVVLLVTAIGFFILNRGARKARATLVGSNKAYH